MSQFLNTGDRPASQRQEPQRIDSLSGVSDSFLGELRSWLEMHTPPKLPIYTGIGTPEGAVKASVGALFLRRDGGAGTSLYVKQSGTDTTTGWVGK